MRIVVYIFTILFLILYSTVLIAEERVELNAFPVVQNGMKRYVIVLEQKDPAEENELKVEIIPGRVMKTDGVNVIRLGTHIDTYTIEGWGYTYHKVVGQDVAISTLMAVPEDNDKKDNFVTGKSLLVRYNSRLPIVVYAPNNYEIRYRIWSALTSLENAELM